MNQNNNFDDRENITEEISPKKKQKSNLIAFVVCVLLAFVLWLVIRNADDTKLGGETPTVNNPTTEQVQ